MIKLSPSPVEGDHSLRKVSWLIRPDRITTAKITANLLKNDAHSIKISLLFDLKSQTLLLFISYLLPNWKYMCKKNWANVVIYI